MKRSAIDEDALDAYIYGYPIVLMETTRKAMLAGGLQSNRFINESVFPGPGVNIVVRPNVDTLYTTAWLDFSGEPVVLLAPNTYGKYYVLEFVDDWTNVFASIGPRTTGTAEQAYLIAGPGWRGIGPQNLPRIDAPTNTAWILGRVQTDGPKDYALVNKLQSGFLLAPLGYWMKYGASGLSDITARKPVPKRIAPMDLVEAMDAATFFTILATAMAANPPAAEDAEMNGKLAALGLTAGASFDYDKLPPSAQSALASAMESGPEAIRAENMKLLSSGQVNGWSIPVANVGYYGTNYIVRAVIAMNFLGANVPEDAVYGFSYADENAQPFKGANRYKIHFDSSQYPPVNAFWSITVYDREGFLTENTINRYAISPHLQSLNYNPDGSLDIFIQNDMPSKEKLPNWLPAPKGSFNLLLRMYWPGQEVLDGQWRMTPVRLN